MEYKKYLHKIENENKYPVYNLSDMRQYIFKWSLACYQQDFLKKQLKPQTKAFIENIYNTSGKYMISYDMPSILKLNKYDILFFQNVVDITCLFILSKDYKNVSAYDIDTIPFREFEKYIHIYEELQNSNNSLMQETQRKSFFEKKFELKYLFDSFYEKI